jgi:hypothetical protein
LGISLRARLVTPGGARRPENTDDLNLQDPERPPDRLTGILRCLTVHMGENLTFVSILLVHAAGGSDEFRSMKLRTRLVFAGVALSALPLATVCGVLWLQGSRLATRSAEQVNHLVLESLDDRLRQSIALADALRSELELETRSLLARLTADVARAGGIGTVASAVADWESTNQFNQGKSRISLPTLVVGGVNLPAQSDPAVPVPFVDDVLHRPGATATIFQRMNESGDMLRVASSVRNAQGRRAIGTYIPTTMPDGKPNPVLATVLKGERFVGRAFVVNQWYVAAYQPFRDAAGKVAGMLYVGIPEATALENVKAAFGQTAIGEHGHLFAINTKGADAGRYVISKGGTLDGQLIPDEAGTDGVNLVRTLVDDRPRRSSPAPRANSVTSVGRARTPRFQSRILRYTYYAPWDWVVAAVAYEDEIGHVQATLERRHPLLPASEWRHRRGSGGAWGPRDPAPRSLVRSEVGVIFGGTRRGCRSGHGRHRSRHGLRPDARARSGRADPGPRRSERGVERIWWPNTASVCPWWRMPAGWPMPPSRRPSHRRPA